MADLKTKKTAQSPKNFLDKIKNEKTRRDCHTIMNMMKEVTGEEPKMWGSSIVGFGSYVYKYASGHAGEWPITGFSPRKQNLTLYIMPGFEKKQEFLKKLGKHKTAKSCLYIKSLADVDLNVLKKIVKAGVDEMCSKYGASMKQG